MTRSKRVRAVNPTRKVDPTPTTDEPSCNTPIPMKVTRSMAKRLREEEKENPTPVETHSNNVINNGVNEDNKQQNEEQSEIVWTPDVTTEPQNKRRRRLTAKAFDSAQLRSSQLSFSPKTASTTTAPKSSSSQLTVTSKRNASKPRAAASTAIRTRRTRTDLNRRSSQPQLAEIDTPGSTSSQQNQDRTNPNPTSSSNSTNGARRLANTDQQVTLPCPPATTSSMSVKELLDAFHSAHPGLDDLLVHLEGVREGSKEREVSYMPDHLYTDKKQAHTTHKMRAVVVDWIMEVCDEYHLQQTTFDIAINYFDRFLSIVPDVTVSRLQLVAASSLLLASKVEEIHHPDSSDISSITACTYTPAEVVQMEKCLLKQLSWNLNPPPLTWWVTIFLQLGYLHSTKAEYPPSEFGIYRKRHFHYIRKNVATNKWKASQKEFFTVQHLCVHMTNQLSFFLDAFQFPPSMLAAAVVNLAAPRDFPLKEATGYSLEDISLCSQMVALICTFDHVRKRRGCCQKADKKERYEQSHSTEYMSNYMPTWKSIRASLDCMTNRNESSLNTRVPCRNIIPIESLETLLDDFEAEIIGWNKAENISCVEVDHAAYPFSPERETGWAPQCVPTDKTYEDSYDYSSDICVSDMF